MKKLFIAICGICAVCTAYTANAANDYVHPIGNNQYASTWKVGGDYNTNLTDISSNTYKDLKTQICHDDTDDCKNKVTENDGTFQDERAVVLDVAQEIYANGAKICTTQIQSSNSDWRQYVWLSYHYDPAYYNCRIYCKPGYIKNSDGTDCVQTSTTQCDTLYSNPFTTHKLLTNGGNSKNITDRMQVFSFANETGLGASNKPAGKRFAKHIVLGVTKHIENGIIVAPIEITGKREEVFGVNMQSWIDDVKTNTKFTVLCAPGYAPDAAQECKKTTACEQVAETEKFCNNYDTGFDPDIHLIQLNNFAGCNEYRCKLAGQGFKSSTDKTCVDCGEAPRSGVLANGECKICPAGQCVIDGECKDCGRKLTKTELKQINKDKECWLKTKTEEFWGCVLCPADNQCWKKNSSGNNYSCGTCSGASD